MTRESVAVVVFNDNQTKVLLQKREDLRIWGLPGGHIELNSFPDGKSGSYKSALRYETSVTE